MVGNTTTTTTTTTSTSGRGFAFSFHYLPRRKKNIRRRRLLRRRPIPRAPSHIVVIAILFFCCLQCGILITHRDVFNITGGSSSSSTSSKIKHRSYNNNNNNNSDSSTEKKTNQTKIQTKPYFVFHVGIGKTATTTIQCGLSRLSGELARDDNYYYIGKPCAGASSELQNGEQPLVGGHYLQYELNSGRLRYVGTQLLKRLQRHYVKNQNVIFSVETFMGGLTNVGYETLKNVLLKDFHVRIVVSYRRYFEWVPSIYYQENSQIQPSSLLDFIIHQVTVVGPKRRIKKHPTLSTIQKYQPYFDDDLYIININDDEEGDVLTNFICNVLPTATNVCNRMQMKDTAGRRRIQQDSTTNTTTAPSFNSDDRKFRVSASLDWTRLRSAAAAIAAEEGSVAAASSYSNGLEIILAKERFELYQKTYPEEYRSLLTCLNSKQQRDLLNLSIEFEQELVDYIVSSPNLKNNNEHIVNKFGNDNETSSSWMWRQKHYDDFYKYVRKGKYCEINTTLALEDTNSNFMRYVFVEE